MGFPDTIEGFGYQFSEDGRLQDIKTGKPFQFEVKENDPTYNQEHYEALGELITPYVYYLLEERCGLQKHPVPCDPSKNESQSFIFCSENFCKAEKLLILIHGSGSVRAGQWSRRLIINDNLNSGTQIPFIEKGLKDGYGVVVLNTNDNKVKFKQQIKIIRGCDSPERHAMYIWKKYIRKCSARKIAIVAHSYGGVVTTRLWDIFNEEIRKRVFAIALTDSVHYGCSNLKHLRRVSQNWVTSLLPLDSPVVRNVKDVPCVSAGCDKHEMTSWSSFSSIFKFFEEKLLEKAPQSPVSSLCPTSCVQKKRKRKTSKLGAKETSDQVTDVPVPMEISGNSSEGKNDNDPSSAGELSKKLKED